MTKTENIRKARESDFPFIWQIFQKVIETGDTYAFEEATTESEARKYWMNPEIMETFVYSEVDEQGGKSL
jgi:hypothetical protein